MIRFIFKPEVILSVIFVMISWWLFNTHGVKHVVDSHRYLNYADNLQQGFYFEEHNFWYIGYAVFILLVHQIHHSELAIVIAQNLLSLFAVICLFRASKLLFDNVFVALLTSLTYLTFFEILTWNFYILCESIYLSFTCFSLYLLARIYKGEAKRNLHALTFVVILFSSLIKPTGIALCGAVLVVILINLRAYLSNLMVYRLAVFFGLLVFTLLLNRMLTTYRLIDNYQLGEVVHALFTLPTKPEYQWLIVNPPDDLYIPSNNWPPLIRVLCFMTLNPVHWAKLFLTKAFYFIVHIRPYWSIVHNLFSALFLIPFYVYFLQSLIRNGLKDNLACFSLIYILFHLIGISSTSIDWDGRFLMPVLPLLFLYTAPAIGNIKLMKMLSQKGHDFSNKLMA